MKSEIQNPKALEKIEQETRTLKKRRETNKFLVVRKRMNEEARRGEWYLWLGLTDLLSLGWDRWRKAQESATSRFLPRVKNELAHTNPYDTGGQDSFSPLPGKDNRGVTFGVGLGHRQVLRQKWRPSQTVQDAVKSGGVHWTCLPFFPFFFFFLIYCGFFLFCWKNLLTY